MAPHCAVVCHSWDFGHEADGHGGGFALSRAASSTFVGPMPMSVMACCQTAGRVKAFVRMSTTWKLLYQR